MNQGYCWNCGYNLRGLADVRCPECGRVFDPACVSSVARTRAGVAWRRFRRRILITFLLGSCASLLVMSVRWTLRHDVVAERCANTGARRTTSYWYLRGLDGLRFFRHTEIAPLDDIAIYLALNADGAAAIYDWRSRSHHVRDWRGRALVAPSRDEELRVRYEARCDINALNAATNYIRDFPRLLRKEILRSDRADVAAFALTYIDDLIGEDLEFVSIASHGTHVERISRREQLRDALVWSTNVDASGLHGVDTLVAAFDRWFGDQQIGCGDEEIDWDALVHGP